LDKLNKHKKFAAEHGFAHLLLSDEKGEVCRAYNALTFLGLLTKRRTIIIDENGVIRRIIDSIIPSKHVEEALNTIRAMK
jgi:peroxiredoxin Q/BCP